MKKIYTVVRKLSQFDIIVQDYVGRERKLYTDKNPNVGDSILVVNDIVIGTTKKENIQVFEV